MDLRDFHNRLRIMVSIDMHEMVESGIFTEADGFKYAMFSEDPFRWLIRCDDESAANLWALIERRAGASEVRRAVPPPPPPPTTTHHGRMPPFGGQSS